MPESETEKPRRALQRAHQKVSKISAQLSKATDKREKKLLKLELSRARDHLEYCVIEYHSIMSKKTYE